MEYLGRKAPCNEFHRTRAHDPSGAALVAVAMARKSVTTTSARATGSADVYVSPNGNDAWTGSLVSPNAQLTDGPVRSLARAQALIRARIARNRAAAYRVELLDGVHLQTSLTVFTYADTVAAPYHVTYAAYAGATPVISGGRRLTGFVVDPVTGRWTLHIPEVEAGTWYFGTMWVNGARAEWPIRPVRGADRFHVAKQVGPSGANAALAPVQSVSRGDRFNVAKKSVGDSAWTPPFNTDRFGFNPGELDAAWTNLSDVRIQISHSSANSSIIPLASISGAIATMNSYTLDDAMFVGTPWRRLNVYEDLGAVAGEMYLNRTTGVLTYVPRPGETPANSTVIAPVLNNLILISNGASHGATGSLVGNLHFSGLTFSHTNSTVYSKAPDPSGNSGGILGALANLLGGPSGAIMTIGAANVTLDHVTLAHLGEAGVIFGAGSNHNTLSNSIGHDLGSGAFIAADETATINNYRFTKGDAASTPGRNIGNTSAYNNLVYDFGLLFNNCAGIAFGRGANNVVSHNEVHDGPSFGIALGFDPGEVIDPLTYNNYIGHNHVYRMGYEAGVKGGSAAGDFGGLYTIGPQQGTGAQPGTIIEFNKIHDVSASAYPTVPNGEVNPIGIDASTLYNDDRSSGLIIRNNLVYNASNHLHILKGMHHHVYNNIFYSIFPTNTYGNMGYYPIGNFIPTSPHQAEQQVHCHTNLYAWGNTAVEDSPQAAAEIARETLVFDYNLYFNYRKTLTYWDYQAGHMTLATWRSAYGQDAHSLFDQDPLFANPSVGDFSLAPDSPALSLGFVPFDVSTAGRV